MKQMLLLLAWLINGVVIAQGNFLEDKSQSAGKGDLSSVRKGYIRMNDGSYSQFRGLTLVNDSVWFTGPDKTGHMMPLSEVQSIHRTNSYALTGALAGGGAGLAIGFLGANALADFGDYLMGIITFGLADDADTRREEVGVVVFSTLVGAGAGLLIGSFIKREKVVYEQKLSVGIYPGSLQLPGGEISPAVTFQISF